ncbi:MAG: CPBP family intramembrane metalloprotease [Solobacterium sp.]|nr:CPBP family intramembrane metalloprotease [Solobacterium sp.]
MPSEPKIITKRQARKQINLLIFGLVIMVLLEALLEYGKPYLLASRPELFAGVNADLVFMIGELMIMAITSVPFIMASVKLNLNIGQYMRNPHYRLMHTVSLICIGIALRFLSASLSQLFYILADRSTVQYEWFGIFTGQTYILNNIVWLLIYVFLRPLYHEIIFRGIIQRHLGHYGRYFGVLGSAFLYALCQRDLPSFAAMFFLGWYLSTVTLYAHSIIPSIRISISLNLFLWVLNVIPEQFDALMLVIIVLVYILAALYIFSIRGRNIVRYGATESTLWKLLISAPSTVILIILFLGNAVYAFLH